MLAHLRTTARSLKPGGVYVVQISCAFDRLPRKSGEDWVQEQRGLRVRTVWSVRREDRRRKLSFQTCSMDITERGRRLRIRDRHVLRLWTSEDIRDLIRRSGVFQLAGIYDGKGRRRPHSGSRITGEMGNCYYVLCAL